MKKYLLFTTICVLLCLLVKPGFSQCNSMPTTAGELADCNFEIALRYAPEHSQEVDDDGDHSLNGRSDFLTAIDYDGDWICINNWNNLAETPNSNFDAYVYYSVVWTKTHWYILYAYYHPRDWSNAWGPFGIFDPEHENDLEGILVIVRRTGEDVIDLDNAVLEAGVTVYHLDFYSYIASGSSFTEGNEDVDGTLLTSGATHPKTSQEAKGHGCKAFPQISFEEDGVVTYKSNAANNADFPSSVNDSDVDYALVDIFEPGGLWSRRNNTETFASWGKFSGDDGGVDKANAPWTWQDTGSPISSGDGLPEGYMALNPAVLTEHYFNSSFPISDCYQFQPYDCSYRITASQLSVCNNKTVDFEIKRDNNAALNNLSITWGYDSSLWECVEGCGANSSSIKLKATSNFSATTEVMVKIETIDCGILEFSGDIHPGDYCAEVDFHFEDEDGNYKSTFCPGEEIFINGSASQNESHYFIDAWRRPIGSTTPFNYYAAGTGGWTQGEIGSLSLTQLFAPTQFVPGYEYEIKLAVSNSTTGWTFVTHQFTVLSSCCQEPHGVMYNCMLGMLSWQTSPNGNIPNSYWVELSWGDPSCCSESNLQMSMQWQTTTNFIFLPFISVSNCFSVRVGADCGDGNIIWSDKTCSNCEKGKKEIELKKGSEHALSVKTALYPNPTNDIVNLSLKSGEALQISVEVFDPQGKVVERIQEQTISDGQFNAQLELNSDLPKGVYFVLFKTNYGTFQEKLIVQ